MTVTSATHSVPAAPPPAPLPSTEKSNRNFESDWAKVDSSAIEPTETRFIARALRKNPLALDIAIANADLLGRQNVQPSSEGLSIGWYGGLYEDDRQVLTETRRYLNGDNPENIAATIAWTIASLKKYMKENQKQTEKTEKEITSLQQKIQKLNKEHTIYGQAIRTVGDALPLFKKPEDTPLRNLHAEYLLLQPKLPPPHAAPASKVLNLNSNQETLADQLAKQRELLRSTAEQRDGKQSDPASKNRTPLFPITTQDLIQITGNLRRVSKTDKRQKIPKNTQESELMRTLRKVRRKQRMTGTVASNASGSNPNTKLPTRPKAVNESTQPIAGEPFNLVVPFPNKKMQVFREQTSSQENSDSSDQDSDWNSDTTPEPNSRPTHPQRQGYRKLPCDTNEDSSNTNSPYDSSEQEELNQSPSSE